MSSLIIDRHFTGSHSKLKHPKSQSFIHLEVESFIITVSDVLGLKKSEGRQETSNNCICIHGYLQPLPFIERIYPQLTESDDGFVDWLLVCFPKTKILLEQVRNW